jgi:hypothetical protein
MIASVLISTLYVVDVLRVELLLMTLIDAFDLEFPPYI